jgi:1-acyl-sn-glycerol-3-phosphate acyltransferase
MATSAQHQQTQYNVFLEVFGRIWAVWGIVSFVVTFLIILGPSMLSHLMPEKKGQDFFIAVSRWWMRVWLVLVGCPVKVKGWQHFAEGENYIVVYNHNALLDVPISAPFIPAGNKTIAKASFAKVPLFSWFYKRGAILVDRNSDGSRRKSYEAMKRVLGKGIHMCLYPEGTRNRTAAPLKPFYDGAFKLAAETQKSIIPGIIKGTRKAMPIHKSFFLLPVPLQLEFLPPVSPQHKSVTELKEEVFNKMLENYTQK